MLPQSLVTCGGRGSEMGNYDLWKSTDPWWEGGPEPVDCMGCDEPAEGGGDLCAECLKIEENSP